MKKILIIIGIVFSIKFSSYAQTLQSTTQVTQKQDLTAFKSLENVEEDAKIDAKELGNFVLLDEKSVQAAYQLFVNKYTVLYNNESSDNQKIMIRIDSASKIRSTLNSTQMMQLEKNTELYARVLK